MSLKIFKNIKGSKIKDGDWIGRGIFYEEDAKKAKNGKPVRYYRFMPQTGKSDISVDRFDFCSYQDLVKIQEQNASNRNNGNKFCGWVKSQTSIIRKNNRDIKPNPMDNNPYHALIVLPGPLDKGEQKKHAVELAKNFLQWQPKD